MIDERIRGLGTALITPFSKDNTIDFKALDKHIDSQIESGVDFLVVNGTTAEPTSLDDVEYSFLWQHIAHYVNRRVPLVLGMGGNNTEVVQRHLLTLAYSMKDSVVPFAAILSVCPYYVKPTQKGLYAHFKGLAEVTPIPLILYNVPSRTGVNLEPQTIMKLFNHYPDKIVGVKEASGNVKQIKKLIRMAKGQFMVFSGDDGIAAPLMAAGADGLISVASNAYPAAFRDLVHNADMQLQKKYADMIEMLFEEGNPVGIKALLAQRKTIRNYLRLPLVPASNDLQRRMATEDEKLK